VRAGLGGSNPFVSTGDQVCGGSRGSRRRGDFSLFSGNAGSRVSTTIENGVLLGYKAVNITNPCNQRPSVADKKF
jgi:hypothetical protein